MGQGPARTGGNRHPLTGVGSGRRLQAMAGLDLRAYVRAFERRNLLGTFPGKSGRGDRFPRAEARAAALGALPSLSGRRVVFVGKAVADAFGHQLGGLRWMIFRAGESCLMRAAMMPHPSGVNPFYKQAENRRVAGAFLRREARASLARQGWRLRGRRAEPVPEAERLRDGLRRERLQGLRIQRAWVSNEIAEQERVIEMLSRLSGPGRAKGEERDGEEVAS